MSPQLLDALCTSVGETAVMVSCASALAAMGGLPLAIVLVGTARANLWPRRGVHAALSTLVNGTRSTPFVILLVAVLPLTRWLVGTTIGTAAAIVPLALSATPFVARLYEAALEQVDVETLEAAQAFGATRAQVVWRVLVPEALPGLVVATTVMVVNLVALSAMAGAVGGGGLGDLAIRHGYQRFQPAVMVAVVLVLIVFVNVIQSLGNRLARRLAH